MHPWACNVEVDGVSEPFQVPESAGSAIEALRLGVHRPATCVGNMSRVPEAVRAESQQVPAWQFRLVPAKRGVALGPGLGNAMQRLPDAWPPSARSSSATSSPSKAVRISSDCRPRSRSNEARCTIIALWVGALAGCSQEVGSNPGARVLVTLTNMQECKFQVLDLWRRGWTAERIQEHIKVKDGWGWDISIVVEEGEYVGKGKYRVMSRGVDGAWGGADDEELAGTLWR